MVFNFISSTPVTAKTQTTSVKATQFNFISTSTELPASVSTSAANLDNLITLNTEKVNTLPQGSVERKIAERRLASLIKTRQANPTPVATAKTKSTTPVSTKKLDASTIATALKAANLPANILSQALAKLGVNNATTPSTPAFTTATTVSPSPSTTSSSIADTGLALVGGGTLTLNGSTSTSSSSSTTSTSSGTSAALVAALIASTTGSSVPVVTIADNTTPVVVTPAVTTPDPVVDNTVNNNTVINNTVTVATNTTAPVTTVANNTTVQATLDNVNATLDVLGLDPVN